MKTLLSAALVLLFTSAFAQNYTFKVIVNKGNNQIKTSSGWQPIKVGASLNSSDELRIADNSYLGLVHATGKPLEVKKAGNYKVVDLAGEIKGGSGVLNKYTDFILSSNDPKNNKLTATGAVHRGPNTIEVYLPRPEASVVYGNEVIVNWNTSSIKGPYIVTFSSLFGDELDKIQTSDSLVSISLIDDKFRNEDNFLIRVVSTSESVNAEDDITIKRISKADRDRINKGLKEIEDVIADETALNKLYLGSFFEQNKLYIDASVMFLEAIALEPEVQAYVDIYQDFLLRNGLKTPAIKKKK